jgi:hypothetical protein
VCLVPAQRPHGNQFKLRLILDSFQKREREIAELPEESLAPSTTDVTPVGKN